SMVWKLPWCGCSADTVWNFLWRFRPNRPRPFADQGVDFMQRRAFSRHLLATGAAALVPVAGLHSPLAQAQAAAAQRFKEGTDYVRLGRPAPVDAPAGQVEVLEFFAYTCIHCFNFEPVFESWKSKAPAHVVVRRVPVAFSEAFVPLQR